MAEKAIVYVNKETVSDDSYKVGDLYQATGTAIRKGDLIGSIVTSKADIDIEAPDSGYVHYNIAQGQDVRVGGIFAIITDSAEAPIATFASQAESEKANNDKAASANESGVRISKGAQELMAQHNLDATMFAGKTMIAKQDVEDYLAGGKKAPAFEINPDAKRSILIVGGGGHAKVCIDLINQMDGYEVIGVTDTVNPIGTKVLGAPVLGSNADFKRLYDAGIRQAAIGIGALTSPKVRSKLFNELKQIGYSFPNLIHPSAVVEPSAQLGEGNQIMAASYISSDVKIGNNGIINSGCIISHECELGDNVHIAPGAALAGTVKVGDNTVVGMNATVLLKVKIGKNVLINNGAKIIKDVPDNSIIKD